MTAEFHGSPIEVERALRRALRALQLAVALPATALLWWAEAWWWLPIPFASSFLLYEWVIGPRRDRPSVLRMSADEIAVDDPVRGRLALAWSAIDVATASWRRVRLRSEVVVMLADRGGPRLALRFVVPAGFSPGDVDLDVVDRLLAGPGRALPSIRAVAPFEVVARQPFEDPRALDHLRTSVPAAAWERHGARTWAGSAPALDPYGFHLTDPDGWLVLDGDRWELRRAGSGDVLAVGGLDGITLGGRSRPARLVLRPGDGPVDVEVPLLAIGVPGGPRVHLPAAPGVTDHPALLAEAADHHTHFPEGASLVWHVLRNLVTWPEALAKTVSDAGISPTWRRG